MAEWQTRTTQNRVGLKPRESSTLSLATMSIETNDNIISRLLLRELGFEFPRLGKDASLTAIDVEDSFLSKEDDIEFLPTPKPNFESEPE